MKKFFLLNAILFLSSVSTVKAQRSVYDSLVVEDAHWIVSDIHCNIHSYDYGYLMQGDTIVNSIQYKKVYSLNFIPDSIHPFEGGCITDLKFFSFPYHVQNKSICLLMRESNRIVYYLRVGGSNGGISGCEDVFETQYFDFNKNIGDTIQSVIFQCNGGLVMPNCDSFVTITNIYISTLPDFSNGHKIFQLSNGYFVYEGIGSSFGLPELIMGEYDTWQLFDYCKGEDWNCGWSYLNTQQIVSPENNISIFSNENLFFISTPDFNPSSIQVINELGQVVSFENTPSRKTSFNTTDFSNGIYFVRVNTGKEIVVKKFEVVK